MLDTDKTESMLDCKGQEQLEVGSCGNKQINVVAECVAAVEECGELEAEGVEAPHMPQAELSIAHMDMHEPMLQDEDETDDEESLKKTRLRGKGYLKKELRRLKPINFLFLTIAGIINATGVTIFLMPVGLVDGGFSGTSYLVNMLIPFVSFSIALVVLNFPIYLIAYKKIGIRFLVYSLYAIGVYSLFSYLYQYQFGLDLFSGTSPITLGDPLLSAVFGGLISGVGSGLTIRYGGAIDGVEVLAVLFAKKLSLTVGVFVMIYNLIVYIAFAIIFQMWLMPLYSIIAYAVGLKAVDFIVEGFDKAKSAMIITSHEEEVMSTLSRMFGRGITVFDAHGYHSKQDKSVIYIVINRFQISRLKAAVKAIDQNAFITISEVSETMVSSPPKTLQR